MEFWLANAGWVVALSAIAAAIAALLARRRALRIVGTRVLIGEAMRRRGITPAQAEAAGLESDLFRAQRECAECSGESACRIWLAAGRGTQPPEGCPNRAFFDQVARKSVKTA